VTAARILILLLAAAFLGCSDSSTSAPPPNVVVVLTDDHGWGDVGAFGATDIPTPNLDALAADGMRLTSFYSAPSCTPSRGMLLTGAYGQRLGLPTAYFPGSTEGLSPEEITLAELLRERGYATALVGKWHLGDAPPFLPTRQGFDEYFGIPYSNDMGRVNPIGQAIYPDLPLLDRESVVEREPDQALLTRRYTERAVDFIARSAERPFFLMLAHSMPHWPIAASDAFAGTTARGPYGDVIAEIDWSVGELVRALDVHGVAENTLVLFVSDNGPWLLFGDHAGSAGGLREGKGTSFEGGVRVPAIARFPGRIPAGSASSQVLGLIDVLPTVARLAGAAPPSDRAVDGRDVWSVLAGDPDPALADREWVFFRVGGLEAVRRGRWKLHVPHDYVHIVTPGVGGESGFGETRQIGHALFDLESDPAESEDVSAREPQVVAALEAIAETWRADLGDKLTGREGSGVRPPAQLDEL